MSAILFHITASFTLPYKDVSTVSLFAKDKKKGKKKLTIFKHWNWLIRWKTQLDLPSSKLGQCSVVNVQSKLSKVSSGSFRFATPASETFVLLKFNLHNDVNMFNFPVAKTSSVILVPERLSSSSLTKSIITYNN